MKSPLERLRAELARDGIGAAFISAPLNVQWLTGFTGSFGRVLVTPDHALFLTDSRYTIQAAEEVDEEFEQRSFGQPKRMVDLLNEALADTGVKECGFEDTITVSARAALEKDHPEVVWSPLSGQAEKLRRVKSPAEIAKIRDACRLADACMEHVQRLIQPGIAEFDIHLEVEFFYRRNRAELAFEPIVVSGANSARPHGKASEKKLERGDFVTIDCGGRLVGYCSDITRTFVVEEASDRTREIYEAVLEAQLAALDAMAPGKTGKEIDEASRIPLRAKGLDQYFGHGLGHGLGLYVHDPGSLSGRSEDVLEPGMVFTVEPGVYIEGFGGVRIEDDVLVTETGIEILTHFTKELLVLP
jgi:Xaa-Pro aminopeptidase